MDIYIKGIGNISPQNTFAGDVFLDQVLEYNNNYLTCKEPDYKEYFDANTSRRMGKIIKMGVVASMSCLKEAGVKNPGAIITGTGLGCIQDTEKFLTSLIENKEQLLTPTSFIQSTHNTISAQIALMLKCMNYNFTYTNRGFSFENSLLDAMLLIKEGTTDNVLVGGAEETTPNTFKILERLGHWKKEKINNLHLLETNSKGTVSGEGASFFLLSNNKTENYYAKIKNLSILYKPDGYGEIEAGITQLIKESSLEANEIDLILLGLNGDKESDGIYHHLMSKFFRNGSFAYFKHLCGEYQTASSFALWLGAKIIKKQNVPPIIRVSDFPIRKPIRTILIYNHYRNTNHSIILLQNH